MSIPDHARANFQTLLRAASSGDLALMECADVATGEPQQVGASLGTQGDPSAQSAFVGERPVEQTGGVVGEGAGGFDT